MSKSYVYIDAPTLDNSDQSKFILNEDFQYVQAGDSSKGNVAQFPLYNKFIGTDWNNVIASNSLPRTVFKSGRWALSGDINLGGDYITGNTAQVHISNFIVGKLDKLRFRFFEKSEITDENRVENFIHTEISDYSTVPKVYILESEIVNGVASENYKLVAIANHNSENIYELDRDFYITGKKLITNNYRLAFIFAPINSDIIVNENTNYSFNTLRNYADNDIKKVGIRSVPRGPLDNKSYICYNSGTQSGIGNGQNRLLDFDYYIDNDLIEEYLGGASSRHHISALDIESLNYLKYSAPSISPIGYNRKSTSAQKVFVSHASMTRNDIFNITGENIVALQIPFESVRDASVYENGETMINNQFNGAGGLWHTNRVIWIWQGEGSAPDLSNDDETNISNGWVKSNEVLAFSYFDVPITYTATFGTNGISYKGKGIWVAAKRPSTDGQGNSTLAVHYYENNNGEKYSYNSSDKIYSTNTTGGFIATANIKAIFNYKIRSDWFDYIENKFIVNLSNPNINVDSISLGDWRIYVDSETGNLVVAVNNVEDSQKNIFVHPKNLTEQA